MKKKVIFKNILNIFLIFLLIAALFSLFAPPRAMKKGKSTLGKLIEEVEKGNVKKIIVFPQKVEFQLKDQSWRQATKDPNTSLEDLFLKYGLRKELKEIEIVYKGGGNEILIWGLISILPVAFLIFFFWWLLKQGQQGAAQVFKFGQARPRIYGSKRGQKEKVTFDDVGGLKEAKEELKEVVDFLKNPKKYLELGAKIPRGVLLIGPPGCGKTLLARVIAFQAGVPFFSVSASEIIELFVGVGSARIRSLFDQARKAEKAIVFIDEIDSIGKIRGVGATGGHEEREQTLNQLLSEMDGIGREEEILVVAATNRPELLDPALLRPGRFDRRIVLDLPDINEREEILKIHSKGKPLASDVNLKEIARTTPGFSGADLANLINEAAILAGRKNNKEITQQELREAMEKVLLGPEKKSHILSKEEKKIAAYHESGHAIVASSIPETEPIQKISIVSRGIAAGYTLTLPKEERKLKTKKEFLAELATLLGGFVAEKIVFGDVTTGAANDLKRATELAKKLVMEYGMSRLGPIRFGERESLLFLGRDLFEQRSFSEKVAEKIDKEIERFIKDAQLKAEEILKGKRNILEKLAQRLIEKETIEKKELEELMKEQ